MAIAIPRTKAASPRALASLAERYGSLPSDYADFLSVHDGATPTDNVLDGSNNSVGVRGFLAASEIISTADEIDGLGADLIPIAYDGSGNYVCIGSTDHKIYFWDHEVDRDNIVSESFRDFLNRLQPFDLSSIHLQDGQVERVWVNPDFKPEF